MNEENSIGKINKLAFWPAVIALVVFVIAGIVNTQAVGNAMTKILSVIANYFGAYINILSLVFLILAAVIIIGKYGDVIIGGKDAKPDYSMPTWCAMSICSGIGTGLLFWAIGEPIFHYMQTNSDWTGTDKNSRYLCGSTGDVGLEFYPVCNVCSLRSSICGFMF